MPTGFHRGSAEIYAFPARGRFALTGAGEEAKPAATLASPRVATAFGGSWYHEEAIQEAERARKN